MTDAVKHFTLFGNPVDEKALAQLERCLEDDRAVAGALMADHHLGYSMPIGGVIAYQDAISPTGVGFDIACGNKAVKTDMAIEDFGVAIETAVKPWMREIQRTVAFGMGRRNETPFDHELFDRPIWSEIDRKFPLLKEKARAQLGTVGSGNHYVDLLVDDEGRLWIANHFGSRGLGHTIASGFMAAAAGMAFTDRIPESEDPIVLATDSALGEFYVEAMQLAGEYAYAGRDYVIDQVLGILGTRALYSVHNHHNFAWLENGQWVVRKGATPLTTEPAFIGGSMGDSSVIVRGTGEDIGALGSAPHGAGRVMSRTAAAGKLRKMWVCSNRDCDYMESAAGGVSAIPTCPSCGGGKFKKMRVRDKSTAAIDWAAVRADLTERGIVVLGAGADEAPGVYKNLATVLKQHSNIEVLEVLRPIGVVMAGQDEYDPYKD